MFIDKMQNCGAQSQWIYLENNPAPKTQGTLWKRGQKDLKRQRIRSFAVKSCLRVMSEATLISPMDMSAHKGELNKDDTKGHAKVDREKARRPQP